VAEPPSKRVSQQPTSSNCPAALGKFLDAVTEFLHQADKDLAAHPVANVLGGIVVGILIGRLIGRR
jgi:hypothetical protein